MPAAKVVSGMGERPVLVHPHDEISLIRVLHDAVTFSTIADMGPILPLLSSTPPEHHAKIDHATQVLLTLARQFAQKRALN
ncbi:hypothetical protein P3T22_003587 [Paraburkholderia sp. GAS348]